MKNPFPTLDSLLVSADADRRDAGRWTVHCYGRGNAGKLYNCAGETAFEAIEDAWRYIQLIADALATSETAER